VAPDNTFTYRVYASNSAGPSAYSNTASVAVIVPAAPIGLTAAQQAGPAVALSWTDNATTETGYVVESSTDGLTFSPLAALPANSTSYVDSSIVVGGSYTYRVAAFNLAGMSGYSNTASLTVVAPPPADPTGLTAALAAGPQVSLSWTDNAVDETGFVVERADNGGAFAQIATPAAFNGTGTVTYVDATVSLGSSYAYRVAAVSLAGQSGWSNTASADVSVPADPTNLAAVLDTASHVALGWTDNANNEAGYFVERSTDGVNFSPLASLAADAASYTDIGVTAGSSYTYRVYAANALGSSGFSNTASITMPSLLAPAAPSNLSASNITRTSLTLSWADNSSNEDGFTVQVATNSSFSAGLQTLSAAANATSVDITGLARNTRYYFRVQAFNAAGTSAWSPTLNVRTAR
jgi:fibronectin type 3 domain-containing protein